MTNKEILEKAIQKAIDGGWNWFGIEDYYDQCSKCGQESFHTTPASHELYHSADGGKWVAKTRSPFGYWDDFEELYILPYHDLLGGNPVKSLSIYDFIFNHEFVKSIWSKPGEAKLIYYYPIKWNLFKHDELHPTTDLLTEWQYHLQQMVIAEDPIKYLEENI